MLIQFSITIFLSFRDETVLSLSTNKDNSHSENLLSFKNEYSMVAEPPNP